MNTLPLPLVETVVGPTPGPTLTISILMHGDEVCGLAARDFLLGPELRLKRGRVHVATLNREACEADGGPRRFVNADLNRLWGDQELPDSYEGKRIAEIRPLFLQSDAILDIHSMPEDAATFSLVSEERPASLAVARLLCPAISRIVVAPAPANRGRALFQTTRLPLSVPIVVVECGKHGSSESDVTARAAVAALLAGFDMLETTDAAASLPRSRYYRIEREHKSEHGDVSFIGAIDQFDPLPTDRPFALDGTNPILAKPGQSLLLKRPTRKPGDEAFALVRELTADEISTLFSLHS